MDRPDKAADTRGPNAAREVRLGVIRHPRGGKSGATPYPLTKTCSCRASSTATIVIYIFGYTPLKRISTTNTLVGAVPGALPPMIGWAAAHGDVGWPAWSLFAILFCWQMPHFYAIGWMYWPKITRVRRVSDAVAQRAVRWKARSGRQKPRSAAALLIVASIFTQRCSE